MGPASTSDADIDTFLRPHVVPCHHSSGSCAINRVVDPQLRVLGIDGLRVVDAAVMPTANHGNTTPAVTMIAEEAADMIRGLPALTPSPRTDL